MPDGQNPKSIKAPTVKYKDAEKVTYDPTTKGFKKQETIGNKTYFDKKSDEAIPGTTPGKTSPGWKDSIIKRLQSGVSPEELVVGNHIDPSQVEEFRQYYKPVYTEPTIVAPKTTAIDPAIGTRAAMTLLPKKSPNQPYDEFKVNDLNGQTNVSRTIMIDPTTQKEIDPDLYLKHVTSGGDQSDFSKAYSTQSLPNVRAENVRNDAQGATNLPTMINGVPVTGNTTGYTDPLLMKPKGDNQSTVGSSTGGGFKNGGLIKKIRKYASGGEVDPNEFEQFSQSNPMVTGLGATALNAAIPGAGTALTAGMGLKDAGVNKLSEIDPTTGKYKNKTGAYGAGLINAATKLTPIGQIETLLDKDKTIGEKALSFGTWGLSDAIQTKKNVDGMESNNMGLVDAAKLKEEQDKKNALAQTSLSQQLTDRSQGLRNGGKIIGKGNGTSDSITAKIKEDSFVVPAKNADKAELVRKVVLKAPTTKANLNQGNGEKVKVSNGEVLFTPQEKAIVESKGINLDDLAPDAKKELPGDKQQLIRQKEMLGFKDGGSLADALKSGNKTTSTKKAPTYTAKKKAQEEELVADVLKSQTPNLIPEKTQEMYMGVPIESNDLYKKRTPEETAAYNTSTTPTTTNTGGLAGKFSTGDVSKALETGIPLAQIGFGLSQLKKQGKRPVGEIDKDYLASIDAARTGLQVANANAKYGFTPEENSLINQENQNLTNAQRYTARNLGGGAGNSYNMERNAINNSFGRGLKAKVENANLKLQKQGIASDKQTYLDNLIANKAGMSRQLFNDKMNAFNTNQTAGGNLVGAGIKNLLGSQRYSAEMDAMKNTANLENQYLNNI